MAQRLGQHVGRAVPHDIQPVGVAIGDDLDFVRAREGKRQIDELAVHLADDRRLGQPFADRLGKLADGGAVGNFLDAAVREFH